MSSVSGFIDLFGVGEDGRVYTAWWRGSSWGGWALAGNGIFNQRTPIAAVSSASGLIDLFAVGENGFVYTASWRGSNWDGWKLISNNAKFPRKPRSPPYQAHRV